MTKRRFKPTRRYAISLGVYGLLWLAILASAYFLVVSPRSQRLRSVQAQLDEVRERLVDARASRSEQMQQRLLEELHQAQQRLGGYVVEGGQAASVTFQMGQLATQVGVRDFVSQRKDSQSQGTVDEDRNVEEVWIDVSFESSFVEFARMLNLLERNQPVVFVQQFSIRKVEAQNAPEASMGLAFLVRHDQVAQAQ